MNGGTCVANSDGFTCYCPLGYSGATCAEGNEWIWVELQLVGVLGAFQHYQTQPVSWTIVFTSLYMYRGGFRGSSMGLLEPPFLKLATYQQTLTELADTRSSSLELRSAVQSRQIALDPRMCAPPLKWVSRGVVLGKWVW